MPRKLVPRPLYSCSIVDEAQNIFCVTKWAPNKENLNAEEEFDYEEEAAYRVEHNPGTRYTCECYAGLTGKYCRHKEIVDIFKANPEKLGSISYYSYDRKRWSIT